MQDPASKNKGKIRERRRVEGRRGVKGWRRGNKEGDSKREKE